MRTPTLEEVRRGAKRAAERVAKWPQWKRDLSPRTADPQPEPAPQAEKGQ